MLGIIVSEMLATNVNNNNSEIPAMNVSDYNFQKCCRQMLPIRKARSTGDKS